MVAFKAQITVSGIPALFNYIQAFLKIISNSIPKV